ncbi:MAG: transcriptional repressor [Anaerolineae bacterium]|nr:transcriptional repressor [Anaerolineae bacterium]
MTAWEQQLTACDCRITMPRRAVMGVLLEAESSLAPQEILERGRQVHARLGLVTVYRTLELFLRLNLVRRVHREDGCHGYVLISPGHHHVLLCRDCGRTVEFPGGDDLRALIHRVEGETGYLVDGHLLQLFGHCATCQENKHE